MIPVIALYEAWPPFLVAVAYVLFHHGIIGTLHAPAVYNHPAARERPWLFAGVHASFFACASIACVVSWGLHERARMASQSQMDLLSTIVDSLRDGLVVIDSHGRSPIRGPDAWPQVAGVRRDHRGRRPNVSGAPCLAAPLDSDGEECDIRIALTLSPIGVFPMTHHVECVALLERPAL